MATGKTTDAHAAPPRLIVTFAARGRRQAAGEGMRN